MLWNPDIPVQFGITDAELWVLVGTSHSRAEHKQVDGVCIVCAQQWPCTADKLAVLTRMASRYSS